jgi:hypothetical protein
MSIFPNNPVQDLHAIRRLDLTIIAARRGKKYPAEGLYGD